MHDKINIRPFDDVISCTKTLMASISTYCTATEQKNYVHYILVLTAIYTIISKLQIHPAAFYPSSKPSCPRPPHKRLQALMKRAPRSRITLLFFCPPVCCSSTSLCHRSTSSRCDGSIVDVSHAFRRCIRMTVCQPFHHHTVKNSSATPLYRPTHVHILKQSTGTVNNVHCINDLYRKGRKCIFVMVLKYDRVSTLY